MHGFQHTRARILFDVACAFGISASCVGAWTQIYASAFLPAAAIAALYGLIRASDMIRRVPAADRTVEVAETATNPVPVVEQPELPEPPAEVVAEAGAKRKPKAPRQKSRRDRQASEAAVVVGDPEPEVVEVAQQPQAEVVEIAEEAEPDVPELKPAMHVVDSVSHEPEYIPATPLFEAEPFVRQQRAAFGRKAR